MKGVWQLARSVALCLATLGALGLGCRHQGDSIVLAGDGTRLSSAEIERDPLALLPAGALGVVTIDAQAAFGSQMGPAALSFLNSAVPFGAEANFDPKRDVQRVVVGFYSLQGADMAAVVQGNFDPDAIRASVAKGSRSALGVPITQQSYAGNDLYMAGEVGVVVVTRHAAVTGNETGIRRTLDRIRDKRLRREVPDWMGTLLDSQQASVVGAADLTGQAPVAGITQQMPFMNGLKMVRVLGNFASPGINLTGALTYPDEASAAQAKQSLNSLAQLASYSSLLALFGIKPPVQSVQLATEKNDVQVALSLDAQGASGLLDLASRAIRTKR